MGGGSTSIGGACGVQPTGSGLGEALDAAVVMAYEHQVVIAASGLDAAVTSAMAAAAELRT